MEKQCSHPGKIKDFECSTCYPARLTPDREHTIRFRAENEPLELSPTDVRTLLAEIGALRAELKQGKQLLDADNTALKAAWKERDRLREALENIAGTGINSNGGYTHVDAVTVAKKALDQAAKDVLCD